MILTTDFSIDKTCSYNEINQVNPVVDMSSQRHTAAAILKNNVVYVEKCYESYFWSTTDSPASNAIAPTVSVPPVTTDQNYNMHYDAQNIMARSHIHSEYDAVAQSGRLDSQLCYDQWPVGSRSAHDLTQHNSYFMRQTDDAFSENQQRNYAVDTKDTNNGNKCTFNGRKHYVAGLSAHSSTDAQSTLYASPITTNNSLCRNPTATNSSADSQTTAARAINSDHQRANCLAYSDAAGASRIETSTTTLASTSTPASNSATAAVNCAQRVGQYINDSVVHHGSPSRAINEQIGPVNCSDADVVGSDNSSFGAQQQQQQQSHHLYSHTDSSANYVRAIDQREYSDVADSSRPRNSSYLDHNNGATYYGYTNQHNGQSAVNSSMGVYDRRVDGNYVTGQSTPTSQQFNAASTLNPTDAVVNTVEAHSSSSSLKFPQLTAPSSSAPANFIATTSEPVTYAPFINYPPNHDNNCNSIANDTGSIVEWPSHAHGVFVKNNNDAHRVVCGRAGDTKQPVSYSNVTDQHIQSMNDSYTGFALTSQQDQQRVQNFGLHDTTSEYSMQSNTDPCHITNNNSNKKSYYAQNCDNSECKSQFSVTY